LEKSLAVPSTQRLCLFHLSIKPFSLYPHAAGTSELFGGGEQVRSLGSVIWRVINSPTTKWTFYDYSESISPSWETNKLGLIRTPFGDTQRFLGECRSSAVCLALPFQAADSH
jgi:hypothetical protein